MLNNIGFNVFEKKKKKSFEHLQHKNNNRTSEQNYILNIHEISKKNKNK
jgi:hypothetical protein